MGKTKVDDNLYNACRIAEKEQQRAQKIADTMSAQYISSKKNFDRGVSTENPEGFKTEAEKYKQIAQAAGKKAQAAKDQAKLNTLREHERQRGLLGGCTGGERQYTGKARRQKAQEDAQAQPFVTLGNPDSMGVSDAYYTSEADQIEAMTDKGKGCLLLYPCQRRARSGKRVCEPTGRKPKCPYRHRPSGYDEVNRHGRVDRADGRT